ncbi:MAG: hypothetical protein ABI836_15950 [Gemmatimonadota bacterium]
MSSDLVDRHALGDSMATDSAGLGFGTTMSDSTSKPGSNGTGSPMATYSPSPAFAGDIHRVPIGTILDYAVEVVHYDDSRSNGTSLPKNSRGQSPSIMVTPAEGVWEMTPGTMSEGHIVARIQSDGDYLDLGLASGLNYLWVGNDTHGDLGWVLVPATAFAPLKDLTDTQAKQIFNQHAEVSIIPLVPRDF